MTHADPLLSRAEQWLRNWGKPGNEPEWELIRDLLAEVEALQAQMETERMRLVACMTAALGNTPESVAERLQVGHPYWSASYGDVCAAVDREIALRAEQAAERTDDEKHKNGLPCRVCGTLEPR